MDNEHVQEPDAADLNGDGKINAAERFVAKVGEFDDALEERAERGGIVGAAAGLLHRIVDTLDVDADELPDAAADDAAADDASS